MLAEASSRAARNRVSYMEVMLTPDNGKARVAAAKLAWPTYDQLAAMSKDELNAFFAKQRQELLQDGVNGTAQESRATLDQMEARWKQLLNCNDPNRAGAGCKVVVRYIFQMARAAPLNQTFAQMVAAMETAKADPRLVGMNLVQAEDTRASMMNFPMQMAMLDYINRVKESEKGYEGANVTLHAGELAPGLVPPEGLQFHIRDSIRLGHAKRIGHGVDVMYEDKPYALLKEMADKKIMVEICLFSNEATLGIRGKDHPLELYLKYNVPVALATDNQGVTRSDMTREFQKAVNEHDLDYPKLKTMARTSLEHAFLPGAGLWSKTYPVLRASECAKDRPESGNVSSNCRRFLDKSEKARLQWELEKAFAEFEKKY
ncbi:MAG TPA: homocysteine S-methyltransferase family protein [Blastocatellia bacterium]|nr:homocysteine S-methyltransferase family protein [Blastocatellia bacterium]